MPPIVIPIVLWVLLFVVLGGSLYLAFRPQTEAERAAREAQDEGDEIQSKAI